MTAGHNGWTNYATWRINLELFNERSLEDVLGLDPCSDDKFVEPYYVSQALKDQALDAVIDSSPLGLARDWARAFVEDANFKEIANNMIDDYLMYELHDPTYTP
jgi:hypothetical protein